MGHSWARGSSINLYYIGAYSTIRLLHRYEIRIHTGEIVGLYARLAGIYLCVAIPLRLISSEIPGGNTFRLLVCFSD
jgi:hypothetical protein